MLKLSKKAEYALMAVKYIASKEKGACVTAKVISDAYTIPYDLLSKVLQQLVKFDIITSYQGVKGGYSLTRTPDEINLIDIISAIDSDYRITECMNGGPYKSKDCTLINCCSIRDPLIKLQKEIDKIFKRNNNIADYLMKLPVYLDNHATTMTDPRVFEAMTPFFTERYGNASSKDHSFGWEAEAAVENAREQIARLINAEKNEIYFTGSATESINISHFGITEAYFKNGCRIISSSIEHSAVMDSLSQLNGKGVEVTFMPVDNKGNLDLDLLSDSVKKDTILVSIMAANNEIGTINNLEEIGKLCRDNNVFFHTDAAQALGKINIDVKKQNIDLASFSAHKIYGPKGIGALYVRKRNNKIRLVPRTFGGGHEKGIRPGTLNVPSIVGFGKAAELCFTEMEEENRLIKNLRDKLYKGIVSNLDDVYLNGAMENRLVNNLNLSFKYTRAENFISSLRDIAVSTGAACSSASLKPSHVLKAIGLPDDLAKCSIRFGLGRFNTDEEIEYSIKRITDAVNNIRSMSPLAEFNSSEINSKY